MGFDEENRKHKAPPPVSAQENYDRVTGKTLDAAIPPEEQNPRTPPKTTPNTVKPDKASRKET